MTTERDKMASTLDAVFATETDTTDRSGRRTLLHLLARGEPVTIGALAEADSRPVEQVRQALAASPDVEYDDQGRIVGAGLTLRPTPHRFEIDARVLYTWCAMDTLVYPRLLGRPAHVTSPCQATGTAIRLTVDQTGVTDLDPTEAVVSLVTPEDLTSIRAAFCDHVHFFASEQAAGPWLADHQDASVLPVAEAYGLGCDLAGAPHRHDSTGPCC